MLSQENVSSLETPSTDIKGLAVRTDHLLSDACSGDTVVLHHGHSSESRDNKD